MDNKAYTYTYDKLYQLTYVDYNDASHYQSSVFDKLGNRRDFNDSGTSTTYWSNSLNQYTKVNTINYEFSSVHGLRRGSKTSYRKSYLL